VIEESNLNKKIKELEQKLDYVIIQLNNLQHKIEADLPELSELLKILQILTGSINISRTSIGVLERVVGIKDSILKSYPSIQKDEIAKAIILALEKKGKLNISQLTEEIRKIRGTASRRIVRERVNKLIKLGILREVNTDSKRRTVELYNDKNV